MEINISAKPSIAIVVTNTMPITSDTVPTTDKNYTCGEENVTNTNPITSETVTNNGEEKRISVVTEINEL